MPTLGHLSKTNLTTQKKRTGHYSLYYWSWNRQSVPTELSLIFHKPQYATICAPTMNLQWMKKWMCHSLRCSFFASFENSCPMQVSIILKEWKSIESSSTQLLLADCTDRLFITSHMTKANSLQVQVTLVYWLVSQANCLLVHKPWTKQTWL